MKFLYFLGGCVFSVLILGLVFANYSDYRDEALVTAWGNVLAPSLESAKEIHNKTGILSINIEKKDFLAVKRVYVDQKGGFLLQGGDRDAMLVFYPFVEKGQLTWTCFTNTKAKKIGGYICK